MADIELIIFDLDGTLIDSRTDIAHALNHTLIKFNHKPLSLDEVERLIGGGVKNLLSKAMGNQDKEFEEKNYKVFINYYSNHLLDNTVLYPSAADILGFLSNKKMAIVSNKPTNLSIRTLEGLKIFPYFSAVMGGDSMKVKKPSPEPLLKVMEELDIRKENTIMIGDSSVDIEAGKRAVVKTCGVTYGYGSKKALKEAGADIVIDHLIELKGVIAPCGQTFSH